MTINVIRLKHGLDPIEGGKIMTINQMRLFILKEYPNAGMAFRDKVTRMKPAQVIAIYKSIQERRSSPLGSLLYDLNMMQYETPDGAAHICGKPDKEEFHQMDIFEYLAEKNATSDVPGNHTEVEVSI